MKSRIFLLVFISLVLGFSFKVFSQSFETIEIGKGGPPKWSPDGTKLAFMSGGWLCVADAEGKGEIQKIAQVNPHIFEWMSDSEFMVGEFERTRIEGERARIITIKTVTMDGKVKQIVEDKTTKGQEPNISGLTILNDGTVGYYEGRFSLPEKDKIFKIIKKGKSNFKEVAQEWRVNFIQRGGEIRLWTIDGSKEKRIPNPKGYDCLQISPDGTKILADDVQGPLYGIWILDLDGKPLVKLAGSADKEDRVELAPGVYGWADGSTAKWSPDSKKITYLAFAQDEYNIIASDIFIVNMDGSSRSQITKSPDEVEGDFSWSPDGTKIACYSDNSGKIFVIKLK